MYKIYKCRKCNDELYTQLDGCFSLNPLGVKPIICPFMDEAGPGEWFDISAADIAEFIAQPPTHAAENGEEPVQQLKAEITAICIDLDCHSWEQFNEQMYIELRSRLRQLLAALIRCSQCR